MKQDEGAKFSMELFSEITDILRETQISQYYRYAKISQLFGGVQKYGYVGDIASFVKRLLCDFWQMLQKGSALGYVYSCL